MNALVSYQDQARAIQDNYRNEMDLYQVQADVYSSQMSKYQEQMARFNIARISAVKGAEGIIESVNTMYSWAWVNKSDPGIYVPWLLKTWFAQVEICVVYFLVTLYLIKRKDVK
jgi:hypothetical protein